MAAQGCELRLAEAKERFGEAQRQVAELSAQLAKAEEAKHTAESQAALQEGVAQAAKREAGLSSEQLKGESRRGEELTSELKAARDSLREVRAELLGARARRRTRRPRGRRRRRRWRRSRRRKRARSRSTSRWPRRRWRRRGSKLKLSAAHLAAKDAQITELLSERQAARAKLGARAEHADELHERLRLASRAAPRPGRGDGVKDARGRAAASTRQGRADELVRSKLRMTAEDGKSKSERSAVAGGTRGGDGGGPAGQG